MTLGTIKSKSLVFWTENSNKLVPLPTKNDVWLYSPNDFGEDAPPAWLCNDCKTVILEYK